MITKENMFPLLIEASPSFKDTWEEFLEEWKEETDKGEELPYYICLNDYAKHIIELYVINDVSTLKKVFSVIESLHMDGDHYVREAATVGILESLQSNAEKAKIGGAVFEKYLLPETLYWWVKVYRFWEQGELLVDDRNKV